MIGQKPSKVFDPEQGFAPPSGAFDMGQHQDDLVPKLQAGMSAPGGRRGPGTPPKKKSMILRKSDPNFKRFCDILAGKRYVNVRAVRGKSVLTCHNDLQMTESILKKHFPQYDLAGTIDYFQRHGGWCDCEVLLIVDR